MASYGIPTFLFTDHHYVELRALYIYTYNNTHVFLADMYKTPIMRCVSPVRPCPGTSSIMFHPLQAPIGETDAKVWRSKKRTSLSTAQLRRKVEECWAVSGNSDRWRSYALWNMDENECAFGSCPSSNELNHALFNRIYTIHQPDKQPNYSDHFIDILSPPWLTQLSRGSRQHMRNVEARDPEQIDISIHLIKQKEKKNGLFLMSIQEYPGVITHHAW